MLACLTLLVPAPALAAPLDAAAARLLGPNQGVYAVAAQGEVLASRFAARPVHPASVSKIASTLALLEHFPPEHRFKTRVLATGPVRSGVLEGDLVVETEGDVFFLPEGAHRVLGALERAGVRKVRGSLRVRGPLVFAWHDDPEGVALAAVFEGRAAREAWPRSVALDPELGDRRLSGVTLDFAGASSAGKGGVPGHGTFGVAGEPAASAVVETPLLEFRSAPLIEQLDALNAWSNNIFRQLVLQIGGVREVERIARARVAPGLRDEIVIDDAAGGGTTNRLSPRAAVALLAALSRQLATRGLALDDVLPVSGTDPGTLAERLDGPGERGTLIGKTGTYGSLGVSALAGVVRTERWGEVRFAILNRGVPVERARVRQDAFVRHLLERGGAQPLAPRPAASSNIAPALAHTQIERLESAGGVPPEGEAATVPATVPASGRAGRAS